MGTAAGAGAGSGTEGCTGFCSTEADSCLTIYVSTEYRRDRHLDLRRRVKVVTSDAETSELHADLLETRAEARGKNDGLICGLELGYAVGDGCRS